MENYLWIGFIGAVLALLFAAIQRKKVMSYSEGNDTMQKIAAVHPRGCQRLSEASVHHRGQGLCWWSSSSC